MKAPTLFYIISLSIFMLAACQENKNTSTNMTNKKIDQHLSSLESKRIYFGHMSVGQNIINGLQDLIQSTNNNTLVILDKKPDVALPGTFLLHSDVGENSKPLSKCIDYRNIITNELKGKIDAALLKFCYIDFNENTDIEALFSNYTKIMGGLIQDNPDITFIHVTVPLRYLESGPSIWLREMLGKPNKSKLANIKRNKFNNMLREKYSDSLIFDLATSESTYPDGSRETYKYQDDDSTYFSLIKEYTDDGGHLNKVGQNKVAADFLAYLSATIGKN